PLAPTPHEHNTLRALRPTMTLSKPHANSPRSAAVRPGHAPSGVGRNKRSALRRLRSASAARALAPLAGRGRKTRPTISIRVRGTRRKRSLTFHAARHARWPLTPTLSPQAGRGSTPSAGKERTEHVAGLRPHLLALRRLRR